TPFDSYDVHGRPTNADGTTITLTDSNYIVRSFHGDVIDGGDDEDTIHAGHGYDKIIGGTGTNVIDGNEGNDVIDAGVGAGTVEGGAGDDRIMWVYGGAAAATPAISGGHGDEVRGDTL